jgi:hypothetical protein
MDLVMQFLAILVGVILSIVLPIVFKWMILPTKAPGGFRAYVGSVLMPYIKAGIGAIIISIAILILSSEDLNNWKAAAMLGFGWQAFFKTLMP